MGGSTMREGLSRRSLVKGAALTGTGAAVTTAVVGLGAINRAAVADTATADNVADAGFVYFDTFFEGATVNEKIDAMNAWHLAQGGSASTPAVLFDSKLYSFSNPIKLVSGMALVGGKRVAAHEYSRATVLSWTGGADTSMFVFPGVQPTQGYPSDNSPRDITVAWIQLQGGGSTHCIPKNDPSTGSYSGKVLWMSNFHGCGFKNFATVWWGWGDGTSISGPTHIQGCLDTPFFLAGSENSLFGEDAFSFMDSSGAAWGAAGKPFIRSRMDKSRIGQVMVTARKTAYHLSVEGGHSLLVSGFCFDAQDSDPVHGSALRVTGGDGIVFQNTTFKGAMNAPASATGGTAANRGWAHVTGGTQIAFLGNRFTRRGTTATAATPLLFAGSGVGKGQVKWGFNAYVNYAGANAVIQQATADRIAALSDPLLTVTTAA
ncbi:hypothetical protein KZZ52_17115 [Dactylosporangium sp. AC04546]|uniref:hypothetical protein n=1 Tax=Dactylosporangium sp. AC04546 TaxID=2862460 RepID=UPI002E7B64BF|nr:hypothetical protein [Dactylosporangium sp. AC04546]WVK87020.1 hypothetical protein KZZ52_17115 [Dactylosporangium sp. AC04546]